MFYNDYYPYQDYRSRLENLFSGLLGGFRGEGFTNGFQFADMGLNLWEKEDSVFCEVELPGVKSEDIDLSIVNNELILKVSRSNPNENVDEKQFVAQERMFGTSNRQITLPADVDPKQINATLENGILHVELHKTEASKPQKIAVSAK